ncbi:ABC transporter permease [Paenibacillus sinopodophylli]|uniref:ABC transporter permease n=1 Tax=Paenibacillus sinopodophylli TaxID=1837342 RepID=UPI001FE77969|nr:ABC transporter permease [Paenibacillus sinopodophylli]
MNGTKQFARMFSAQIKMMLREKQVWFWNIFFPVILMVLFMVIFGGGSSESFKAKVAIVDSKPNVSSAMLLEQLRQIPMLELEQEQPITLEAGQKLVEQQDVAALIILPESEDAATIQLVVNKADEQGAATQAITGLLDHFIQQTNWTIAGVAPTFSMTRTAISSGADDLNYADFLLTGMIGLSVAQGGLFGMVGLVEMRRNGLMKRLRMTPARMGLYGLAGVLVKLLLGIIQIIILTLIGVFGFGANLHINIFSLIIAFLAGGLVFNAMGYLFSSFSNSIEAYMGMANIASMLMMFLSGVFFPLESLPAWLQPVTQMLPLTYFVEGMRDGLIYNSGIASSTFWAGISIMLLWGVVSFLVGSQVYKVKSVSDTK